MPFREEERDYLITNAARDRAEHLLKEMQALAARADLDAATTGDMTAKQAALGRDAMEHAVSAAQRMLESLNDAMTLAEQAARAGGWAELDAQKDADSPPPTGDAGPGDASLKHAVDSDQVGSVAGEGGGEEHCDLAFDELDDGFVEDDERT